jgi:hypothetical protein
MQRATAGPLDGGGGTPLGGTHPSNSPGQPRVGLRSRANAKRYLIGDGRGGSGASVGRTVSRPPVAIA